MHATLRRAVSAWDPEQYLEFAGERLRPALDLLARISLARAEVVYDLGCGTGLATELLARRWHGARVAGVDSSPEMLVRARARPGIEWTLAELATWRPPAPADLLFSNAALHWLPDHARLLPRLLSELRAGGILALQMPRNFAAPSHALLTETARQGPWAKRLAPLLRETPVAEPAAYWRWLAPHASSLEIWET